jgi:hypothetical protein
LTERRTTITRGWRPDAPAQRVDDFLEAPPAPAPAPAPIEAKPARLVERRSIGRRLENWGAWNNMGSRSGGGADCMTGVICESMRRHAVGELHPPGAVNDRIDIPDAEAINRAITKIPEIHRWVLHWTYVVCSKPWGVAGACGFPTSEYGVRLGDAQAAIEAVVGGVGQQRAIKSVVE